MNNPVNILVKNGQSIWLDYIRRDMIHNGELKKMIETDGLSGMTSNPAIFEKAISGGDFYDADIRKFTREGKTPEEIFEEITIADVQAAADEFKIVYESSGGRDGYVSLEVNPHLATDTEGTILEAHRLWDKLNRKNVYIKVPATLPGVEAIRRLVGEGLNINVTLLFGLRRYEEVAEAYISGIENLVAVGKPIHTVTSVASFFVSRMDTLVDPLIQDFIGKNGEQAHFGTLSYGETGIANALLAHKLFKKIFFSDRFMKLMEKGARMQRLLWASTGTKNPEFSDVKYLEALAIPDTINTVPPDTLSKYKDHGKAEIIAEPDYENAIKVLDELPEMGIDITKITGQLEKEGVEKFNEPYDKVIKTIRQKMDLFL